MMTRLQCFLSFKMTFLEQTNIQYATAIINGKSPTKFIPEHFAIKSHFAC